MFKQIPGFSNYQINEEGIVKSIISGKTIKAYISNGGYTVSLVNDKGERRGRRPSNLLKITFPELYEIKAHLENELIFHKAGDFSDCISDENLFTKVQKKIREIYDYNPETGEFYRKLDKYKGFMNDTYLAFMYEGKIVKAHKLICIYMLGAIPEKCEIDHEDHNKLNNKWNNLRIVTKQGNSTNLPKYKSNTSGVTGVSWHKNQQKWIARIMVRNKAIQLGSFANIEDAIKSREEAILKYNLHNNHGK